MNPNKSELLKLIQNSIEGKNQTINKLKKEKFKSTIKWTLATTLPLVTSLLALSLKGILNFDIYSIFFIFFPSFWVIYSIKTNISRKYKKNTLLRIFRHSSDVYPKLIPIMNCLFIMQLIIWLSFILISLNFFAFTYLYLGLVSLLSFAIFLQIINIYYFNLNMFLDTLKNKFKQGINLYLIFLILCFVFLFFISVSNRHMFFEYLEALPLFFVLSAILIYAFKTLANTKLNLTINRGFLHKYIELKKRLEKSESYYEIKKVEKEVQKLKDRELDFVKLN